MKAGFFSRPFLWNHGGKQFIAHSQNKSNGTSNYAEHRSSRFVVGAGNAKTGEEILHD
jgi:hypothetical protein